MNVIVIAGLPGSGKTHLRTTDPELKELPYLDMDELRREAMRNCDPNSSSYWIWRQSMLDLLDTIDTLNDQDVEQLVVEGVFAPGSKSFLQLLDKCRQLGIELDVRRTDTAPDVCAMNIIKDYWRDNNEERWMGRMDILIKVVRGKSD